MSYPFIESAFTAGEIAPALYGRVDLAKFHVAAATMRNAFVSYRGGAYSRAGTRYVIRAKQPLTPTSSPPRIIRFQFNINQGYCLEFGDFYMRVHFQGAPVVETALNITGATQADPCALTVTNSYANGDWVVVSGVVGMTQLNNNTYIIANRTPSGFTLTDLNGVPIDSTLFAAYISGGTVARIFTLTTPYAAADLPLLKFTQSADVMSLTHPSYPPYDLARVSAVQWTLTEVTFAASIAAPGSCTGSATVHPSTSTSPPTLPTAYAYCVTAVDGATGEESIASPIANIVDGVDIASTAGSNIIAWSAVPAAQTYNVYKAPASYNSDPGNSSTAAPVPAGSLFGYVGTSYGTQFVDSNITADLTQTPPVHQNPFAPGQILAVNIASPGSNLTSVTLTIGTSTGSGFVGYPVIVGGQLQAVIVANAGEDYLPTDTISFGGVGSFAAGNITFTANPSDTDTVTLNGQLWTFVASSPGANETLIGANLAATLTALVTNLTASSDAGLVVANYSANATQLKIVYKTAGPAGNSYTLAASFATPSGPTLTGGGSGTAPTGTLNVGPRTGTYPGCVAYFQQRRVYASSLNNPDTYWMSQPGRFLNFDSSVPVTDSDAITGTPWSQQVNGIQFMIPMPGGLVVLTGLGAWQVTGAGGSALNPQPITPSSQQAQPQAFNGCSDQVVPITVNYDIIYVQAKGSIVRDLAYNYWTNIYTGNDLTEISSQLFTGYTLLQAAWCEEPYKVAWFVRNDNTLLSLTYLKEQEVYGWARHDTFGSVMSICSVTEPPVDALYLVVARSPAGAPFGSAYFIERMDDRIWSSVEDSWCVDCGLSYPMPEPNAVLSASGASGNIIFTASASVFSAGNVGNVIRMGGGIATVTSFTDPQHVTATVNSPITATIPNAPTVTVFPQPAGSWTMTAPITTVTGLSHLQGMTVTGLADGVPIDPQVVTGDGTITLPAPASAITVGLGFTAQLQSVYLDTASQPTEQGRRKTITAVTARVERSLGLKSGSNQIDGSTLSPPILAPVWTGLEALPNEGTIYTSPGGVQVANLFTGDLRVNLNADWETPGQVAIQQDLPLPMSVTALIPEFLEGDLPEVGYQQKQQNAQRQPPRGPGAWMLQR